MKTYHDIASDGGSDVVGQVRDQAGRLAGRLSDVRRTVAVMSGKGGVGKSTVSVNLADALSRKGARVGIVDGDINGPSIARIAGVRRTPLRRRGSAVVPAETRGGVRVMSMDLFLEDETAPVVWDAPSQTDAAAWRGLREAGALRELIADTAWGALDLLVVDLPPGSERLPTLAGVMPRIDGALVVTIPSAVSMGVVGRSIRMTQEHLDVPSLALVENMCAHVCPHCGLEDDLFPSGSVEALARSLEVRLLARIPFDPAIARAADEGRCYLHDHAERPAAKAFTQLSNELLSLLDLL